MPNTPGNAPPSVNRVDQVMDATRQRLAPEQARFRQSQDPQVQTVMAWLATPEAEEFLRRMVAQQGAPGGAAGPGPGGPGPGGPGPGGPGPPRGPGGGGPPGTLTPGGPPGGGMPPAGPPGIGGIGADIAADPIGAAPPGGPGAWRPGPPRTAPGMGPSPAPGVPGGERDLSDPESFGPQGGHPLAGIGSAIAGAFAPQHPFFDESTGRTLYPGDPGYQQRDPRGQIVQELAASQAGPRFGPRR